MTSFVNPENKIYGNALNLIVELGPISLMRLLKHFGDFKAAWNGVTTQYREAGLDQRKTDAIISKRNGINPEQSWELLQKHNIDALIIGEKNYPKLLAEVASAPPLLYTRGNQEILNEPLLAVVGTRKMSTYGKQAAQEIVQQLAGARLGIVSGLAFGVDAEALNAAVNASGRTIAVLPSALDDSSISPRANYLLAQKIMKDGCLVSEYPLGASVQKQNFPIRNRIIAGLTLGTLVVEADEESGALITAQYALDFNREVFALPGSIFSPVSRGTNKLISQGARLTTSALDIIEELNLDTQILLDEEVFEATEEEAALLALLAAEPLHIDDIIRQLKVTAGAVNATLTMLEMKGRVKNLGGAKYIKVR